MQMAKYEKKKIADFSGAVDKKIELVGRQIDKAKEFNPGVSGGLLKKMFVLRAKLAVKRCEI